MSNACRQHQVTHNAVVTDDLFEVARRAGQVQGSSSTPSRRPQRQAQTLTRWGLTKVEDRLQSHDNSKACMYWLIHNLGATLAIIWTLRKAALRRVNTTSSSIGQNLQIKVINH